MGQVPECSSRAAETSLAPVDRFGEPLLVAGWVEVGQHIDPSSVEGAPQRHRLWQRRRTPDLSESMTRVNLGGRS